MASAPAPLTAAALLCLALPALSAGRTARAALASPEFSMRSAYPWKLALTDQAGKRFDLAEAAGRTLVLSFLFTSCGSACPMQTARLAKVQSLLPDSLKERSRFVSVSIDPRRDSASALADYAFAFRIDTSHWRLGATPDTAALARLMAALYVGVKPGPAGAPDHEMAVLLIDPKGGIAQRYLGDKLDEIRLLREIGDVDRVSARRGP